MSVDPEFLPHRIVCTNPEGEKWYVSSGILQEPGSEQYHGTWSAETIHEFATKFDAEEHLAQIAAGDLMSYMRDINKRTAWSFLQRFVAQHSIEPVS